MNAIDFIRLVRVVEPGHLQLVVAGDRIRGYGIRCVLDYSGNVGEVTTDCDVLALEYLARSFYLK